MSGYLDEGQWREGWYDTKSTKGHFVRTQSSFRDWVTVGNGGQYPAEVGRYHLFVSLACPWAHRTLIARVLKRLEHVVAVSVLDPVMSPQGWAFSPAHPDHINGFTYLHQLYTTSNPKYSGRVSVPVLWDAASRKIVNNESSEIVRMFNSAFSAFGDHSVDLYPKKWRDEIDRANNFIYDAINNGVYRCGFATTQGAYDAAFRELFSALDVLEIQLKGRDFLFGETPFETDWRLFATLVRFDAVYYSHFKCNRNRIEDFPNLSRYLRQLYQIPKIAQTINFDHIKRHYFISHPHLNPSRIVPLGPRLSFGETDENSLG